MAQDVSVDHGAFLKATGQMRDVIPTLDQTAKKLDASVQAAEAGWKGEAKTAFDHFATRLHGSITNLHKSLIDLTTALEQGNKHLGGTDSENTQLFGKIDTELSSQPFTNLV
ncbi:WXG100 family type VII secretion target [Nocardia sp. NPDC004604]|uniref:WXG100 family type VII secretion target n=1 Tax=Nocardia sp. NPDC004604 TaxID=3157013 RepID=UPI0033A7F1A2